MFCNSNADTNKNIIKVNNYLDKVNLVQNKNLIKQKNLNIKLINFNGEKFLET